MTTLLTELAPAPITHQQQELLISLNMQLKETSTPHYILLEKLFPQTLHMKLYKYSTSSHTKLQLLPPSYKYLQFGPPITRKRILPSSFITIQNSTHIL